jgi:hypothetical protein
MGVDPQAIKNRTIKTIRITFFFIVSLLLDKGLRLPTLQQAFRESSIIPVRSAASLALIPIGITIARKDYPRGENKRMAPPANKLRVYEAVHHFNRSLHEMIGMGRLNQRFSW